jgi:hypothetical protein
MMSGSTNLTPPAFSEDRAKPDDGRVFKHGEKELPFRGCLHVFVMYILGIPCVIIFLFAFVVYPIGWLLGFNGTASKDSEPKVVSREAKQVMKENEERKKKQGDTAIWRFWEEQPDRLAEELDLAERTGQPTKMLEYKLQEAIKKRDEQRARLKEKKNSWFD